MGTNSDLAKIASLIGHSSRAAMLEELLDGQALTATELAIRAEIAPSTASEHLAQLVDGGLLRLERQGRHRYYCLAGPEIASLLEAMGTVGSSSRRESAGESEPPVGLYFARVCYDHLAGWLAVAIRSALITKGILVEDGAEHRVTSTGEAWLSTLGIDLDAARRARRSFARRCLDWSERRPHLAGALGSALLQRLFELGWILRVPGERTVELTAAGRRGLARELDLEVPSASISAGRASDVHGTR